MEASLELMPRKTVKYSDIWIRIILSFLAAHLIMVQDRFERYYVIAARPLFLVAFIASIIVAFIVISYVRAISIWLDKKFTWEDATLLRLLSQIFMGIVLAVLVNFALISIYYYIWRDMSPAENRWFERYGLSVSAMLTILNAYYIGWYIGERYGIFKTKKAPILNEATFENSSSEDTKSQETGDYLKIAEKDIQSVIHEHGTNIIYLEDGSNHTEDTLDVIYNSLPALEYEYFPRNCIIKGSNILDAQPRADGRYDVWVKVPNARIIQVSERQGVKLDKYRKKK